MRRLLPVLVVVGLASVLFLGAGIGWPQTRETAAPPLAPAGGAAAAAQVAGDPAAMVASLEQRVAALPKDASAWAALGAAYVERARVTTDATYYPRAEQALEQSLTVQPEENLDAAVGSAALAAARHDFGKALDWAQRALAIAPEHAAAYVVEVDALVELGRYDEATVAARKADDLRPGVPTFTRLSYLAELRGQVPEARRLMALALQASTSPDDRAFAHLHLGRLARQAGQPEVATRELAAGLQLAPDNVAIQVEQAHLQAAAGRTAQAVELWAQVVQTMPLPEYLLAYGELLESLGRESEAQAQYDVLRASAALAAANGVNADLEIAHYEADHGSAAEAVTVAQAEYARRQSIHTEDALGWALHAAGRHDEAIVHLQKAVRLGTRDARLHYHLGMAELAAGDTAAGRRSLRAALAIDPSFSPLYAPEARRALTSLGKS